MISLEQINQQFNKGNISIPVNIVDEQTKIRPRTIPAEQEMEIDNMAIYGFVDAVSYYDENNLFDEITIPLFSSTLVPYSYPDILYSLELYRKEYGCPQCLLTIYTAYCTPEYPVEAGEGGTNVYTELTIPNGSAKLDNTIYYSVEEIIAAYPPPDMETTVTPDSYYCNDGFLIFLKEYQPLNEYDTLDKCLKYADDNRDKSIQYGAGVDVTLTVTDISGSGRFSAQAMIDQLYAEYEQNYSDTHVPCIESFEVL